MTEEVPLPQNEKKGAFLPGWRDTQYMLCVKNRNCKICVKSMDPEGRLVLPDR